MTREATTSRGSLDTLGSLTDGRQVTSLRQAFGEAITSDGVSLIPVARVSCGATSHGSRRVVGIKVKPLGVFAVSASVVQWMPITRRRRIVVAGLGVLGIMLLAARFRPAVRPSEPEAAERS